MDTLRDADELPTGRLAPDEPFPTREARAVTAAGLVLLS